MCDQNMTVVAPWRATSQAGRAGRRFLPVLEREVIEILFEEMPVNEGRKGFMSNFKALGWGEGRRQRNRLAGAGCKKKKFTY